MEGLGVNVLDIYRGKKIFITGHTGFKGAWLAYWLTRLGAEVTGYALSPEYERSLFDALGLSDDITHIVGDVRDADALRSAVQDCAPDFVFHLAAQALVRRSYNDPLETYGANVMGSVNLLDAVRHCESVRSLVYITSDKCYNNVEQEAGYVESDELGGPDPYSASKACAELVFKSYFLSYFKERDGFGCSSTRAGNVIGGGDRSEDRIVPDIIRAVEDGNPIVLRNPDATRPWQHVLDPLYGYLLLGAKLFEGSGDLHGESFNFGPPEDSVRTVHDLTQALTLFWDDVRIEVNKPKDAPHEATLLQLSVEKAKARLDWSPVYAFDDAVRATGEWYYRVQQGGDARAVTGEQIDDFMKALS